LILFSLHSAMVADMLRPALALGLALAVSAACSRVGDLPTEVAPPADATAEPVRTPSALPAGESGRPPEATAACETHAARLLLEASEGMPRVGDRITVKVTLRNEGCPSLGLPQYRLEVQSDGPDAVLLPSRPEPVVHSLAVAPGQVDVAEFTFAAAAAGQVTLTASASFEVHLGYPGPAYWGQAAAPAPLQLTVLAPSP
jgi:hypothetical protein